MRVAPMRIEVAEASDSVSSPFAVLTTIELADASYFSSVPVTECATAFFAVLAVCAGEADAEVATASARMPALSSWNIRDIWIVLPCLNVAAIWIRPREVPCQGPSLRCGNRHEHKAFCGRRIADHLA